MDGDRFPLSSSREPNPLRPYYVPPSIGHGPASAGTSSTSPLPVSRQVNPPMGSGSLTSSARDVFPELDIDLAGSTGEVWQHTKRLFDTLAWRYTSVLLAQPFDVAKTILQVSLPPDSIPDGNARSFRQSHSQTTNRVNRNGQSRRSQVLQDDTETTEDDEESEMSDEMPDYFSSAAPRSRSPRKRRRTPPSTSRSPSPTPTPRNRQGHDPEYDHKLRLKRLDSIHHVLSALHTTSGAIGWWRATNTTFIYSILLRTVDSFIRSLLLALIGLPDIVSPQPAGLGPNLSVTGAAGFSGLDLSESPNPFGSLVIIGVSSCITGIVLAPLDLVRTRMIITPNHHGPRGLVQNLRRLPSLIAPSLLWLPVALQHAIPQVFSASAPLFLRRQLRISPELTPSSWSLAAFTTSLVDLFVRLPLETLVRRAHVKALLQCEPELSTIIEPAPYTGVWATVYGIIYTEGQTTTKDSKGVLRTKRGHGTAGLVRGWRIGFWGLVGVWGAGAIGPGETKGRGRF